MSALGQKADMCSAHADVRSCQKQTSNTYGLGGLTKATRPADADQCLVWIRDCKLVRTPWLVLRSVLSKNFASEFRGPDVHVLHIEIEAERISARDEPTLDPRSSNEVAPCRSITYDRICLHLFRRSSFYAGKAKATIKTESIEIVARQLQSSFRFHFAPTPSVIALRSSLSLKLGDLVTG